MNALEELNKRAFATAQSVFPNDNGQASLVAGLMVGFYVKETEPRKGVNPTRQVFDAITTKLGEIMEAGRPDDRGSVGQIMIAGTNLAIAEAIHELSANGEKEGLR